MMSISSLRMSPSSSRTFLSIAPGSFLSASIFIYRLVFFLCMTSFSACSCSLALSSVT